MPPKSLRWILPLVGILGISIGIALWLTPPPDFPPTTQRPAAPFAPSPPRANPPQDPTLSDAVRQARARAATIAAERSALGVPAIEPRPPVQPETVAPFAKILASKTLPPSESLPVVLRIFDLYRAALGGYPAAESNAEFVNALAGNNPQGIAWLDRGAAPLNASGELLDHWETPYFFHLIARDHIEIRSAGPDRSLWTADDLQLANRPRDEIRER